LERGRPQKAQKEAGSGGFRANEWVVHNVERIYITSVAVSGGVPDE